jgi:hypothetical protein
MDNLRNVWLHDNAGNPIGSYLEPGGVNYSLNVHDAHVHTILVNRHFLDFDSATESPSVAVTAGDYVIAVADTTGFAAGNHIVIRDAGGDVREHHFDIISLVVNTSITLNRPVAIAYTTSAVLEKVILNMNVVGSIAAPLTYSITPPSDEIWHISRIILSMTDQTAMDDSLFGGLAALTNGVVLVNYSTMNHTVTHWKTNQHIIEDMYDVTYSAKAPAGFYGLRGRFTFTESDVVIRLVGSASDTLNILIQDDLSGLDTFSIKAQGHIE